MGGKGRELSKLTDKVALVTGGGRGIGRAIALALGREGADVAVNYEKHEAAAEEVVGELRGMGRKALAVAADVSQADQVQDMVRRVLDAFGHIDILVNNAGIANRVPFLQITEAEWDRIMAVDLKGSFLVSQAVARHMVERRYGRIINMISISSFIAIPGLVHYQAAKGGVLMLTKGMALELVPYGILVNAIAPGAIATDINRERFSNPDILARRVSTIPMGRVGTPQEVAGAAVYLASDECTFTTGSVIAMDGGEMCL
jgi:NAD(P)-dependent dehydrogenase (short-subunit alcohol dehydrogenase family)